MSGITSNRLNVTIPEGNIATIKSLLEQIQALLPFVTGLSPEERQAIPKINVSNKVFTEDALYVLANNSSLYPAFINIANLNNDLILYRQLDELASISRQLTEKIEDTQMLAGSEAYVTALSVYRLTEAAAVAGMPGADVLYQQLRERFANSGSSNTPNTPPQQ
jgi:hypothetical protein